jgi:hypothetical protein
MAQGRPDLALTVSGCTIGSPAGSTLPGNSAEEGAGIYNSGKATVSNSTLSGNTATAGDHGSGEGGGIYNSGSKMTVSNCTLSNNTAGDPGGGIYNNVGKASALTVLNSVFTSNSWDNIYGPYTDGGGNSFH